VIDVEKGKRLAIIMAYKKIYQRRNYSGRKAFTWFRTYAEKEWNAAYSCAECFSLLVGS
jgi:hypothetical protein